MTDKSTHPLWASEPRPLTDSERTEWRKAVGIPDSDTTLPCIVCGQELTTAVGGDTSVVNQPSDGTTFIAYGQYGSTVFDPLDTGPIKRFLEINVCDTCMKSRSRDGHILHVVKVPRPAEYETNLWVGGDNNEGFYEPPKLLDAGSGDDERNRMGGTAHDAEEGTTTTVETPEATTTVETSTSASTEDTSSEETSSSDSDSGDSSDSE